jgi:hypothetical protein
MSEESDGSTLIFPRTCAAICARPSPNAGAGDCHGSQQKSISGLETHAGKRLDGEDRSGEVCTNR